MVSAFILGDLLTADELAALLKVHVTWVYARTRCRSRERMPHLKIGKYLRFDPATVTQWLQDQYGA